MRLIVAITLALICTAAQAVEINLVAIMGDKAMVEVDGSKPKLLAPGQSAGDAKLLSVSGHNALFEINGQKKTLSMDNRSFKNTGSGETSSASGPARTIVLPAMGGHFFAPISINGMPLKGMIDTGATILALSSTHAKMANIDMTQAQIGYAQTAQGVARFRKVKVNQLRFGDIVLYNVDATVLDGNFPSDPLIGMNILQRFTMQRDADRLTLIQRY